MTNYKVNIPDSAVPFIDELKSVARSGLYAWVPHKDSVLLSLPSLADEPDDLVVRRSKLIKLIEHVIQKKLCGIDAAVGTAIFGINIYAGMPLADRHRAAVKSYDQYWTWENYRREPYMRFLLSVHNFLISEKLPQDSAERITPKSASMGVIGADWEITEFNASYNLPDKHDELIAIIKYRLICKAKSADTLRCRVRWRKCGSSELPTIVLLTDGRAETTHIAFDEQSGLQTFICKVTLPRVARYREEVVVEMLRKMPVQKEAFYAAGRYDWYGITQLHNDNCNIRLVINFPEQYEPKYTWYRGSLFDGLIRSDGLNDGTRLSVKNCRATYEWKNAVAHKSYGISMIW